MPKKPKKSPEPEDLLVLLAQVLPGTGIYPKDHPPPPMKRMMRAMMQIPLEYLESGRSLDSPPSFNEALIASLVLIGIRIGK